MLRKNNLLRDLEKDLRIKQIPTRVTINGTSLFLRHCSAQVMIDDLASWFVLQSYFPKMYFQNCSTGEVRVALGSLVSMLELPEIIICDNPYDLDPKFYGAIGYAKTLDQSSVWQNFPKTLFVLPEVEVEKLDNLVSIHLWFIAEEEMSSTISVGEVLRHLRDIPFSPRDTCLDPWVPRVTGRINIPSEPLWNKNVQNSLRLIASGEIDKVVLARQCSFSLSDPISVRAILHHLQKARYGLLFSIELSASENFLGVTPEILYRRNHSDIEIMALAGTTSLERGDYLYRSKEQSEFGIVKNFIYSNMQSLCKTIFWTPDMVRQVSHLLHLCRNYRGTLHSAIRNSDIVRALHPTPAICGFPKAASQEIIAKLEPFHRGWYASPIGYLSHQKTELYIAIRSALVCKDQLHIFSGAGIVAGSIAEEEWEELNRKMAHFL